MFIACVALAFGANKSRQLHINSSLQSIVDVELNIDSLQSRKKMFSKIKHF